MDIISTLLDTADFPPRWYCGNWSDRLGWLHVLSDLGTFGAYTAIPCVLAYFIFKRRDIPFPKIFWLFCGFIFACGTVHLIEAIIFWAPIYRVSGIFKFATAAISWVTVVALIFVTPSALNFRSPQQLESEVKDRTNELSKTNLLLKEEIEKHRRTEEALREAVDEKEESLALLDTLFSSAPVGVGFLDERLRFVRVNGALAKMNDLSIDNHLGKTVHEVVPPLAGKIAPIMEIVLKRGKPVIGVEIDGVHVDTPEGPPRWMASYYPIRTAKRGTMGIGAVVTDVTQNKRDEEERRKFDEKLRQAQKLESLGVLAGGIAHDFNNLLTGIMGNADIALNELSPTAPARESLNQILNASFRAADLCRQMLAYSGKGRFVVKTFNLNSLVRDMANLLEVSISKNVSLQFGFDESIPAVEGDLTQIRQVVMNLITNASEAIGDKPGVVWIRTGTVFADQDYLAHASLSEKLPNGTYAYLEVSDNGCGMDPETIAKIFDPFFTTKFTGRGLGLAAVLGIVRGHKGAVMIYSQPGSGTTFKVLLPCSDSRPSADELEAVTSTDWRGKATILVVDDEELVRNVARQMLEARGCKVLTASDGAEAVELFLRHNEEIQVILLDLTMPKMDGEATFRALRAVNPKASIILCSGYNEQDSINRFIGRGLAGFVQKPFQAKNLFEKLREVLDEKPDPGVDIDHDTP